MTHEKVAEEANLVADYAGLSKHFTFDAEPADRQGCCALIWGHGKEKALVDMTFVRMNLARCPDKATRDDLLRAIAGAHPDTLCRTS